MSWTTILDKSFKGEKIGDELTIFYKVLEMEGKMKDEYKL